MKIQPIIDRLQGVALKRIEGALEFANLDERPGALPAGYVVPARKAAGENTLGTQAVDQLVTSEFIVLLQLDGARRAKDEISEQIDELEGAVIDRLVGWTMPGASRPITYAGSDMAGVKPSLITWAVRFRSTHHLRKTR